MICLFHLIQILALISYTFLDIKNHLLSLLRTNQTNQPIDTLIAQVNWLTQNRVNIYNIKTSILKFKDIKINSSLELKIYKV